MSVSVEQWGHTPDGRDILLFTIKMGSLTAKVSNISAAIIELLAPDRSGQLANLNVRHAKGEDYWTNPASLGGVCGRFAGRIRGAKFTLDGHEVAVTKNAGENHIHGGKQGFNKRLWTAAPTAAGDGVALHYRALDGEEGFPGNFDVAMTYRLTDKNELVMEYEATTDKPTVLNLTNHAYWNLGGSGSAPVYDHELQIFGDRYLLADNTDMVTGETRPVADTAYDFTSPRPIGLHIGETTRGYDHCYVLRGESGTLRPAAVVKHPKSGRVMEVSTTEPGVQFYTGNYLKPETSPHQEKHMALCLECQHFPDGPNQPAFPSTVLRPGDAYRQVTVHRYGVEK